MNAKILKEGRGWRIGWNPMSVIYKGLVGGDDWAFELTKSEFEDFCHFLEQLSQTMAQMANELMESERIAIEVESDLLWMEAEGTPAAYSLRLILHQSRGCEGNWREESVPELLSAAQMLTVF